MKNENPLVSICIPTYNGAQFIAEAMESAIAQTYPNLEIVVSDDDSKDTTLDIIETYKTKTNIPIHIHHHQPSGIGANWNNCLKHANGEFIKFLFQDDVLNTNCIETMFDVFNNFLEVDYVACKREFLVEDSFNDEFKDKWIERYGDLQVNLNLKKIDNLEIIDNTIFKSPYFFQSPLNKIGEPSTVMFRTKLLREIGFFREDLKQILDYEFAYRILKNGNIIIINEKLVKFRLHGKQTTVINRNNNAFNEDQLIFESLLYNNYRKLLPKTKRKQLLRKHNYFYTILYNLIDTIKLNLFKPTQ